MTAAPGPQQPDEVPTWKPGDPCPACGAKERNDYGRVELCSTSTGRDHKVRWAGPMSHRRKLSRLQPGRTDGGCPTCGVAPGERCRSLGGVELIGRHVDRPAAPSAQPAEVCNCTAENPCGEDGPTGCPVCDRRSFYSPCPRLGFQCGLGGLVRPGDPRHDCCTDEQLLAAAGSPPSAQPVRDTEEGRR